MLIQALINIVNSLLFIYYQRWQYLGARSQFRLWRFNKGVWTKAEGKERQGEGKEEENFRRWQIKTQKEKTRGIVHKHVDVHQL